MQIIELLVEVHVSILQLAQSTILYEKNLSIKRFWMWGEYKKKKHPTFFSGKTITQKAI